MAKKFGKTLLLTAAAASAAAAFYFYLQKKDAAQRDSEEEDYDDFSEDLDTDTDSSRSYVPLNHETSSQNQEENASDNQDASSTGEQGETSKENQTETTQDTQKKEPSESVSKEASCVEEFPIENPSDTVDSSAEKTSQDTFTPLTEQVAQAADRAAETVEEFFDDEDAPDAEPPINSNL